MNMDTYMNAYLDRRMRLMIDEWQLGTTTDLKDLSMRYHRVKDEVESLKAFERESQDRMDRMEVRIRALRERMK